MKIRKATHDDIPALMRLFECAKGIMRASGNLHQWGSGYPSPGVVRADIDAGVCYVVCGDESGAIEATMAFVPGPDPTYSIIEDGAWLDDAPYYVIHRIAVAAPGKGNITKRLSELKEQGLLSTTKQIPEGYIETDNG